MNTLKQFFSDSLSFTKNRVHYKTALWLTDTGVLVYVVSLLQLHIEKRQIGHTIRTNYHCSVIQFYNPRLLSSSTIKVHGFSTLLPDLRG